MAIVGLAMILGATHSPKVRYAGCFLTASGLYTAMPMVVCWAALNNGSHIRKSVGTAWQIGFGNIGGIIATFIFWPKMLQFINLVWQLQLLVFAFPYCAPWPISLFVIE